MDGACAIIINWFEKTLHVRCTALQTQTCKLIEINYRKKTAQLHEVLFKLCSS